MRPLEVATEIAEGDLMTYATRMGPAGAALRNADEATRVRALEALEKAFAPFVSEGAAKVDCAVWLVTARA